MGSDHRPYGDGSLQFSAGPGGEIGRHAGLKILWPAMAVTVQLRSGAQEVADSSFIQARVAKLVDAPL